MSKKFYETTLRVGGKLGLFQQKAAAQFACCADVKVLG